MVESRNDLTFLLRPADKICKTGLTVPSTNSTCPSLNCESTGRNRLISGTNVTFGGSRLQMAPGLKGETTVAAKLDET